MNVDFRLSPVLVIIFHHGERPFTGPTDVVGVYNDCDGVLADHLPRRRAILFDLSVLPESELPDDPETPELYAVLRIMQVIFSLNLSVRIREVLERLQPYSEIPKYRRLIRISWYYFVSYGKKQSAQEIKTVSDTVTRIIGEKEMSTILEMFKAEGKAEGRAEGKAEGVAEGIAKGEIRATLKQRFKDVPQEIKDAIQSMTDLVALESLLAHAESCGSLDEFSEALK